MVDPQQLRFVDVLVQLVRQCAGGCRVAAERLLHDDARVRRLSCVRQALDDPPEEERRDLEVEHGRFGVPDRRTHPLVGRVVAEIALDVREPLGEALEDGLIELLPRFHDRGARTVDELVSRPFVDGDAHDRAIEQSALLQSVERAEGHHLREVTRDPEDHEDVCRLREIGWARRSRPWECHAHFRSPHCCVCAP